MFLEGVSLLAMVCIRVPVSLFTWEGQGKATRKNTGLFRDIHKLNRGTFGDIQKFFQFFCLNLLIILLFFYHSLEKILQKCIFW